MSRTSNRPTTLSLNQLVQQEVLITRLLHLLDDWPEPLPLLLAAQTTLAQHYQSRMDRDIGEFDEVLCVRRDNCKVMIERVLPHDVIRSTCKTT